MKLNYKKLTLFILAPLILASIIGIISIPNSNIDSILPSWIFPVIWTILYIMMGISSYIIYQETDEIPKIYIYQLVFNLLWPFIFFKLKLFTLALIWLLLLILLVIIMIKDFLSKNKISGYLQIPYLLWLLIALLLNLTFIV